MELSLETQHIHNVHDKKHHNVAIDGGKQEEQERRSCRARNMAKFVQLKK